MHLRYALTACLIASTTAACTRSNDDPPPDAGPTLQALAACDEGDFEATPFMGPAFDATTGQLLRPLPTPHIVATTAGWARPEDSHRTALGEASEHISAAIFESPGLLGVSFGGSNACNTARTLTLWTDEEALMAFVWSAPHSTSMSLVPSATLGWETTRWVEMSDQPATWARARAALVDVRPAP